MSEDTLGELAAVQADVARIAKDHPNAVMLAALEVLITIAAGHNPALADYRRLQIYRGIRHALSVRGLR